MAINTRSIRFRLTVWYALILSAVLCIFGGLIWFMLEQRMLGDIQRGLDDEASRFEAFIRIQNALPDTDLFEEMADFCHALPSTSYLKFIPVHGGLPFLYPATSRSSHSHYEVLTRTIQLADQPYRLEIGASRVEMHRTLELLERLLFSLVPIAIAASCFGGAWLSRRALKPVDQITAAVRAIGIENLANRLPMPGTGDELERLTETWNATLARLDSAVAALSRFAADASHELRTPVAVIRTGAEVALRRERDPEAYREALREIAAESERMTALVEDLLFLARRDAGAGGMPMEAVDLQELVRETAHELRGLAEAREIRIHVRSEADDAVISGNEAALRRLFLALLDNALKYSAAKTEVRVLVASRGGKVEVRVEDQGAGISAEDLPHIFERFYRANKARSDAGHGLGLSLAQSIARAHGTAIEVTSRVGRGSAFEVSFAQRHYTIEHVAAS